MAVKKTVEIDVRVKDGISEVEKVTEKVKKLDKTAQETSKNQTIGLKKTSVAMQKLDEQTGGLSGSLIDVGNAAKKGGAAMRSAFIASGIGILVVALGFVISHWQDIKDLIDGSNKSLQKKIDLNRENIELLDRELSLLEDQEDILKLQNGSTKEIRDKQKEILRLLGEENIILLSNLETQLEKEKAQNREITAWERLKILASSQLSTSAMAAAVLKSQVESSERTKELEEDIFKAKKKRLGIEKNLLEIDKRNTDDDDKLTEEERKAKEKAQREEARRLKEEEKLLAASQRREAQRLKEEQKEIEAEQRRLDAIERVRENHENKKEELEAKTLEEKLELDKERALEDLEAQEGTLVEKFDARLAILSYYFDKEQELRDQRRLEKEEKDAEDAKKEEERIKKEIEDAQRLVDAKVYMQRQLASNIGDALNNISMLFDQSTAMSKAAAIADIAIGTGLGFINALDIAQKSSKAAGPAAAFAFPVFYASQVAAVLGAAAQAKRILSTAKTKGGGGGGGGATPTAPTEPPKPSFNIVGNSQANQLAGALNRQDQPIQAYVVSRNMTSQQEMDRNIRSTATVG